MTDPRVQAATQLANIETATGTTLAQFTAAIAERGLANHGHIVSYLTPLLLSCSTSSTGAPKPSYAPSTRN